MKKIFVVTKLILVIFSITSCTTKQTSTLTDIEKNSIATASGKIIKIENGKDGYMATIQDLKEKKYVITISIINLQKVSGKFKRYEVGDTISVKGPSWKDEQGIIHIIAEKLD